MRRDRARAPQPLVIHLSVSFAGMANPHQSYLDPGDDELFAMGSNLRQVPQAPVDFFAGLDLLPPAAGAMQPTMQPPQPTMQPPQGSQPRANAVAPAQLTPQQQQMLARGHVEEDARSSEHAMGTHAAGTDLDYSQYELLEHLACS